MKIKMNKNDKEIIAKIINGDSEKDFSNLEMIDYLYKNDDDIHLVFDESFTEDEKNKINDLFDKIKQIVNESKKKID